MRHIGPRARRKRLLLTLVTALTVVITLWGWFAATKIYAPRLDPVPDDVDVLVQLGGIPLGDYAAARRTAQDLGIPHLVLSNPIGDAVTDRYCGPLPGVEVHCFAPEPSTTRGEARGFTVLAEENGWRSAYVLGTGREHVERVRLYFSRCWDGTLAVNRPASARTVTVHLRQGVYQTAGWLRAVSSSGC
ncbi:hypothetical protein [Corynebacterium terpenotabidum]|uniref:Uncharacterized protein n=1 Tax=Corynebacterium terpenotabidum Y-11 TaxID=1200352 RepID=S4XBS3_9CORY|nr:hypothetical protein [Corynebacterium terpenotabidum]AGP29909.1 hypothetical protein A606_01270 [Corynebacterium terpenotabidum Y-11]